MSSNENSRVDYESGVTPFPMSALTDSGDQKVFTSGASLFSASSGNAPDIRPNGLLTGGEIVSAISGNDDEIDVAALTCYLAGVKTSVAGATDQAITRAATNVSRVNSVTITSVGAVAVLTGTSGASAAFSEVRGDAGGPPYIPVGSIEIAQVRTTTSAAAPIVSGEIFDTIGSHTEKSDFPVYTASNSDGTLTFDVALPAIHTGDVSKAVYASYAEPIFTEQPFANDFVPAETTHSTSSTQVYGATIGASSQTLNQGSFTAILSDGITDNILSRKNETLWFRYYQDKFKSAHILTQGKLGVSRTFGAADNPQVSCTISPDTASVDKAA